MAADMYSTQICGDVDDKAHANHARNLREDATVVLQYLEYPRRPWARELNKGEGNTQEFKSTLRCDLKTGEHNKELEHSVLKNIAGFLNGDGGRIFVGVDDAGGIIGIELDGFDNQDKWELHLLSRIGQRIGKRFIPFCKIEFDLLHGKAICRIDVSKSTEPVYLDERAVKRNGQKDAFYIRGDASAQELSAEETAKYCHRRFPVTS